MGVKLLMPKWFMGWPERIGNRRLTECLIGLLKSDIHNQKESREMCQDIARKTGIRKWYHMSKIMILVSLMLIGYRLYVTQKNESTTPLCIPHAQSNTSAAMVQWSPKLHNNTNCSRPVGHDLPILHVVHIHGLFVGREDDIREIMSKVMKANILNINGAPGFGKSTVAIHVGYRLVKDCTSVRYVNIEDLSSKILSEFTNTCKFKLKTQGNSDGSKSNTPKRRTESLTSFTSSLVAKEHSTDSESSTLASSFIEELKYWSKAINQTTVLILDNADVVLTNSFHQNFIDLINLLVHYSKFQLHVIVVSQEKLLLLENFDRWIVRELSQNASVELLKKLAPGIDDSQLNNIAELVQGCPLALKVIGSILNVYGQDITHELENELQQQPINVLDKVSDQRQRFSVMMDLIVSKLEFLRKCGYIVSLFPGSFSREAGVKILLSKEYLEMFGKYSLLDEYFLGYQHRYKMHRLIREYFNEKVDSNDKTAFETRFYKYYVQFILNYAIESELNDTDEHVLLSESKNIDYLEEMLLTSSRERRNDFLIEIGHEVFRVCTEQLNKLTFKTFSKTLSHISELINPVIYEKLISHILKQFYTRCKCETVTEYFQRFSDYLCIETIHCEQITELFIMHLPLNLSQQEEQFWYNVRIYNCLHTLPFKESFQYYIKYFVLTILLLLIFLMSIWWEENQIEGMLLHAFCKLHLKHKLLVIIAVILLVSIIFVPYTVAIMYGDVVLIVEVGMKIFCHVLSVFVFVFMYMFMFQRDQLCSIMFFHNKSSPQYYVVKHSDTTLTACAKLILMLCVSYYVCYMYLKGCTALPICH